MSNEAYIKISDAARLRGTSRQAVSELIRRGRLTIAKHEYGVALLRRKDVINLKDERKTPRRAT